MQRGKEQSKKKYRNRFAKKKEKKKEEHKRKPEKEKLLNYIHCRRNLTPECWKSFFSHPHANWPKNGSKEGFGPKTRFSLKIGGIFLTYFYRIYLVKVLIYSLMVLEGGSKRLLAVVSLPS